jgi:hypothetical protein
MRVLRSWELGVGAAIALSVALCGSATVALGQAPLMYPECTKKPTPADVEGAKGAHKAASQFYERAEYDKAIRYWNDAYSFDCTANDLLVNIANAHEKLGDVPSTVVTLETYLKRTGPNETIELKVKNLRLRLAMAATAAPTTTAAPTVTAAPTAAPTAPPTGPRPYGNTPWFVAGGGGLVAVIGLILMPVGYGAISSAAANCPAGADGLHHCKSAADASKGTSGRAEVGAGWTMLTIGLVAAGGGVAWQLLYNKPRATAPAAPGQPPPPPKTGLWVSPVGPGGPGLSLGGNF